jgi:hypothetical protein
MTKERATVHGERLPNRGFSKANWDRFDTRVGQLAVVAGVGSSRSPFEKQSHYVTIEYKDAEGNAQSVVFEIGKDAIRPLLSSPRDANRENRRRPARSNQDQ